MKYYFITGTSRGIGKALAAELFNNQYNKVFGIGRSCVLKHDHYLHFHLDFADLKAVSAFRFPEVKDADEIVLVNNSGTLGEIAYCGKLSDEKTISAFNVNLLAPALLMNNFIARFKGNAATKIILNISSGAAQRPIDGWSSYCASKAGLDMLSKTVQTECEKEGNGIRVFSVAPGVVDTGMQTQIRSSAQKDFSELAKFVELKESGQLQHAEVVARKLLYFLEKHKNYKEVVLSLNSAS